MLVQPAAPAKKGRHKVREGDRGRGEGDQRGCRTER